MAHLKMGLCGPGRHEISGISGYIFPAEIDPLGVAALESRAYSVLDGAASLDLYVTGLSVALVSVINVCYCNGIPLTLYHYNRESGGYYPQRLDMRTRCDLARDGVRHGGCYGL